MDFDMIGHLTDRFSNDISTQRMRGAEVYFGRRQFEALCAFETSCGVKEWTCNAEDRWVDVAQHIDLRERPQSDKVLERVDK